MSFRMSNGSDCSSVKVFLGEKKRAWWLIDWLYNGFLIISGIRRGFLMTNKQHSINYTISKGIYGRNNQCRAKRESMPFLTKTECHEPRVKRTFCALTFLFLYFIPMFVIVGALRNTGDSISQSNSYSAPFSNTGSLADTRRSLVVWPQVLAVFQRDCICSAN